MHPAMPLTLSLRRALFALACALCFGAAAQAAPSAEHEAELKAAVQAADAARVKGPADIKMADQAVLKLPAGMTFVPQPAAGQLMKAVGNGEDNRLIGLVEPVEGDWMVIAEYEPSGYIKDDDARDWNVDDLFKSLKEGTDAGNEERRQRGIPELEVLGWVEKPHYNASTHRLVWAMAARDKGAPDDAGSGINYNTYALGREGYVTLNLITTRGRVEQDKPSANALLSALEFNEGKRYADFNSKTDHVAEYGLAALVAGVAAKKLGLLALAAGFFVKFAKLIVLGVAGVGAAAAKFFKGRGEKA